MALVFTIVSALIFICLIVGIIALVYNLVTPKNNTITMENKTKAFDVFMYVGIFITLVVSVTNILQIVFSAIDRRFIDVLDGAQFIDVSNDSVRFAMASLIVVYPLYVFLSWFVSRDIKTFIYKRDLPIRKFFIYTAIFVTVCTVVGTLVSLIYKFLGGELTIRFGLKALTIAIVSVTVFGYYFYSLRRNYALATRIPLLFTFGVSVLVIGSLVWSITIIGTPSQMRMKRIDGVRLSDISRLQNEIFNQFQGTDKLPQTLGELNNAFQDYAVPVDPVTKEMYIYRVLQQPTMVMNYQTNKKEMANNAIFELCATFDTKREVDVRGVQVSYASDAFYSPRNMYYEGDQSSFWNHGVGQTCFKRIITPQMYYGR